MKILKFITSTILLLGISILLYLFIKSNSSENYLLIFIPIFWIFYLPLSWGVWKENIYSNDFDKIANKYNIFSKYSRNLFFIKIITSIGFLIIKFYRDIVKS